MSPDAASVDFTAACLGVEPSPDLVWKLYRGLIWSTELGCDTDTCDHWLECSGYNYVVQYDATHGG